MTKTKLLGVVLAVLMVFSFSPVNASEQVYAKSAPTATEAFVKPVVQHYTITQAKRKHNAPPCKNFLVKVLYETGFRGENLREAWALAMRESGGRADAISSTGDYGIFQFNRAAWSGQDWWNTPKLLTREYNAKIAFKISRGGKTWYPWDLDGQGDWKGAYTPYSTYVKYKQFYNKYPKKCLK
jgi:hypothetical protein